MAAASLPRWGSDILVDVLADLGIEYVAIVPGSSSRGLHDSIVNYHGNEKPEMLLCLHEAAVIAIAHGYAKVTERPMGAAVYANVGVMNSSMAIYNSFADRVPMLILGCNGSIDGAQRRPWIDWVHTTTDTGALIRQFVKFDDSPMSLGSAIEGLLSCYQRTTTKPCAPTYIRLDISYLEQQMSPEERRYQSMKQHISSPGADTRSFNHLYDALRDAQRPMVLFGRSTRSDAGWKQRQAFAVKFGAKVLTDIKQPCAVRLSQECTPFPASLHNEPATMRLLSQADLIVSFDWVDLAGTLKTAFSDLDGERPRIFHISLDHLVHNGWSNDKFGYVQVDWHIQADPDALLSDLVDVDGNKYEKSWTFESLLRPFPEDHMSLEQITMRRLARAVNTAIGPDEICLIRAPIAWDGSDLEMHHPLAFLGMDGGAGVGSGPGMAVGAALALRDHHKNLLPVAILGDGDYFMGANALWTAARYRIPLLVVVANNISFYNDEIHQEKIARARGRPVENKHVGIRIDDPEPDVGKMAESMGLTTVGGQVRKSAELDGKLAQAVAEVRKGNCVVLDVRVSMD